MPRPVNKEKVWAVVDSSGNVVDKFYRYGTAVMFKGIYDKQRMDKHIVTKLKKEVKDE